MPQSYFRNRRALSQNCHIDAFMITVMLLLLNGDKAGE